ncbi:hypothetical protein ACNOYE_07580 [Nannocystaceae bacterium ST9]
MLTRASVRPSVHALLLVAGFAASACTAILVPNAEDDGVNRCNNSDECPDLDDNRYRSQCVYGEGQDEKSSKVCVADFAEINCKPTDYGGMHPFAEAYDDATDNASKGQYVACLPENLGKQGCGFNIDVPCADGLAPNDDDICDDSDPNTLPAIAPNKLVEGVEPAGQDVADQFCRWRFGDENWVCDTSGSQGKWICRDCDPGKPFGQGGCGTMYLQGTPSTVYTDLEDANYDGDKDDTEVTFGAVPEPA